MQGLKGFNEMNNTTSKHYSPYAVINWIADSDLKSGQKAVLLALARFMSKKNGYRVWPSQKLLCEKAGMGETALRNNLIKLLDLEYIETEFVPCTKGPGRYEYTLNVPSECEGTQPRNVRVEPSDSEHKGDVLKGLDVDKKVEALTERTSPSASAGKTTLSYRDRRKAGRLLAQKYSAACKTSPKARAAFWYELGRLYFPDSPKFRTDHRLSYSHTQILNELFTAMPTTGCYVFDHVMENWPTEGKYKSPSLNVLEEHGAAYLYSDWKKFTDRKVMEATLPVVAANLAKEQAA